MTERDAAPLSWDGARLRILDQTLLPFEERVLELIRENRDNDTRVILDRVFKMLEVHTRSVPSRDDLTLVVVRS